MDDFLCYGDFVSLYNDEQGGYVYSNHSSSVFNEVAVSSGGQKNKPLDENVLTFEICPPTRYQFSSHYRDLTTASTNRDLTNADSTKRDTTKSATNETDIETQTQSVYEAEQSFNAAEIIRQRGKPVCYGQTVQLRHKFTNKFVQVSNITTSYLEKQNGSVSLQPGDSINGQFKILPKHKYRREGDQVRLTERLVFESIACPLNYLHVSGEQFNEETFAYNKNFELNMSSRQSTFFILRNSSPLVEGDTKLKNGDVVRFYHHELQGYLVGEGYFGRDILENVHLRLRPLNRERPHSLQSSSSAITYWQIEEVTNTMTDGYIRHSSTVRLLHLCTRRYLCLDPSGKGTDVTLTSDPQDKNSQFKLVSVDEGTGDIKFKSSYCLESVTSGYWIHATNDPYKKMQKEINAGSRPLESLPISKAQLCSVKASSSSSTGDAFNEKQFEDLFVLEKVDDVDYKHYTFVAGMVPYLFKKHITTVKDHTISKNIVKCFKEMIEFMAVDGKPVKKRQKLFRNLGVIDRMLEVLRETFQPQNKHMPTAFSLVYDVLRAYVRGSSRKNKTHVARNMSLYFGHFSYQEGQVHQHAADMVNEFIRDNKDVLERITNDDMTKLVDFIRRDKEYRFLELMDNFCVCQNKAVKDNQKYITNSWLKSETRNCLFFTKMGREIGRKEEEDGLVFVTVDNARSWLNLCTELTQDPKREADSLFFYHQLQTFERLCFGRNSYAIETLTSDLKYVTKEQAKVCLENTQLPEKFRALYCQLIIALFVNTQEIQTMVHPIEELYFYKLDFSSMTEENNNGVDMQDLTDLNLEAFVKSYIANSAIQTSIKVGTNKLTAQVLSLLNHLILLGRHPADTGTLGELVNLLNGLTDKPEEEADEDMYTKEERFMRSESTSAIVEAKIQCLKVIETYFDHVLRNRIKGLLSTFTQIRRSGAADVIDPTLKSEDSARFFTTAKDILQDLFTKTAMFSGVDLPVIMVDLTKYQYESLVTQSMETLYLYFSAIHTLLKHAARVQVLTSASKTAENCAKINTDMAYIRDRLDYKLSDADASQISNIMQEFQRDCKHRDGTPNTTLQNFLFVQGIMDHIFAIMTSKELQDLDSSSLQTISLKLLEALTNNNEQIQNSVFLKLDLLLTMNKHLDHVFPVVKAMFTGNVGTCKQVTDRQICVMVKYLTADGSRYMIVFDILQTLVKPERLGLPLRRNQNLVMRHMTEIRSKISYLFAMDDNSLVSFLSDKDGPHVIDFLATLDLMATCAQNGSKENKASLRSAVDVHLLLMIATKTGISHARLRPCLRALTYAYCEGYFDDVSNEIDTTWPSTERSMLDKFLKRIERGFIQAYTDGIRISETFIREMKSKSTYEFATGDTSPDDFLAYQLDTVIPFCQCFCASVPAEKVGDNVQPVVKSLCEKFKEFLSKLEPSVQSFPPNLRVQLVDCMKTMKSFAKWEVNIDDLDKVLINTKTPETDGDEEREINKQYQTFIRNLRLVSEGLQTPEKEALTVVNRRKLEYKALEQKNELQPLYESFVDDTDSTTPHAFDMTEKIMIELKYAKSMKVHSGEIVFPKPDLHQRYMQALHATLLEEIIKLPPNFEVHLQSNRRKLGRLQLAQNTFVQHGAVECALQDLSPHLGNPHLKESLHLLICLMFHGNSQAQDAISSFFLQRPDVLVIATLQSRIASFRDFAMETEPFRKSLSAMVDNEDQNKVKDPSVPLPVDHASNEGTSMEEPSPRQETGDNIPLTEIYVDDLQNRSTHNRSNRVHPLPAGKDKTSEKDLNTQMGFDGEVERETVEVTNLVLEFVASACRSQHSQLQNYFREQQPVELSTNFVNILVEVIDTVYSRINSNIVSVAIQTFDCLTQIISGNRENKLVVLQSRVCEQSNFMLFMNNYRDCSMKQVYALKKSVGNFWREMTEETCVVLTTAGDSTADLASTAIEYLDSEVALQVMKQASQDQTIKEGKKIQGVLKSIGFQYYLLLERKLFKFPLLKQQDIFQTEENRNLLESFSESTRSVELVKDDILHKLLFRVKDKGAFSWADIKEKIKYGVDRSSTVEKRKDFMKWSEDTTRFARIRWTKCRTPVGKLLVNSWWFFNVAMLMLTIAILIMIGVDYNDGETSSQRYDVRIAVFALGGVHNVLSLAIFIHFVVLQQPQFHGLVHIFQVTRSAVLENSFDDRRNEFHSKGVDSRLQISAYGPKMIYYLLFLAASVCGTALHGFTFALCLIQIVELNLYLKRMCRAVTYNGKYFGMLVVLGVIIMYMYGMVAFLFLREDYIKQANGTYCNSMPQCFVTILHHGLVGTTYDMIDHSTITSFTTGLWIGLFNLSFFVIITILGLYIVLAIIVDGFLHLKENMRQAKNDFRAMCFICGRPNGDFSAAAKGYDDHVKKEHNIWDYIYFFIHLDTTGISEYSALENYVHTQLREGKFDFLPMNRALCLEEHDSAKKQQLTVTKGADRSSELQLTKKEKKLKKLPSFKEKVPAARPKERNAGRSQREEFKARGYNNREVPQPKKHTEEPTEEFDIKPKPTARLQRQEPVKDEVELLESRQDDGEPSEEQRPQTEEQKPIGKDPKPTSRKRKKKKTGALRSSDKSQKSTEEENENENVPDILGELETEQPEGETSLDQPTEQPEGETSLDQPTTGGTADDAVKDGN